MEWIFLYHTLEFFLNWLDVITFSPSVARQVPHHHRNEPVVAPLLNPLGFQFERFELSNPTATVQLSVSRKESCPNTGKFRGVLAAAKLCENYTEKVSQRFCDWECGANREGEEQSDRPSHPDTLHPRPK